MTSVVDADTRPAPLSRLPSLTGLRWIAAMLVFGFHLGTLGVLGDPTHRKVIGWLFGMGLSGVQFFFVLSGFVLVWSARPGDTRRAFWQRRFAKIYPNHVVTWAVVIAVGFFFADPLDTKVAVTNLFLLQAWNPTVGYFYSINTVSWSLSCEAFFYLCLPLVLPLVRRARPWMLYAVVVGMPLLILAMGPVQHLVPEPDRWWFTQVFPVVRSFEFWMGVAAAELMLRGRWRGPNLWVASGIFLAAWVACAVQWVPAGWWTTVMAFVYVLVIAAVAEADVRGTWSPWRSRVMVRLGEVSFAYYLVHVFVIFTVIRLTGHRAGWPGWSGPLVAVGFLLLNLTLAGLLFRFVETPMVRLLRPRRRPAAPAATRRSTGGAPTPVVPRQVVPDVAPGAPAVPRDHDEEISATGTRPH